MFCAFNLGSEAAEISLPQGQWNAIGQDLGAVEGEGQITLDAAQFCLMVKEKG